MLKLWNHMTKMDSSRLAKKIFNWDLSIKNKNWSSNVENIFDDLDLLPIFMNQNICPISLAKQKLMENSIIKWKSDINSKPKLFTAEDYFKLNTNRQQRSLMAQLRCGILPIRIETGRFTNIRDPITGKLKKNEVNRTNLSVMYEK